jgi:glucokinase
MTASMTGLGQPRLTLGIDLGGTKMSAATITAAGEIVDLKTVPRPPTAVAMDEVPIELAVSMITADVGAIGVGAAGLVRADDGILEWGPNVAGERVRFGEQFEAGLGLPTAVDNDANLAALAETRIGAAQGYQHVVMITLGTGIGGGWMIGGERYHGRSFAGEIGHMIVDVGGPRCTCGQSGCWETFVSGRRFDQLARGLVASNPHGLTATLASGVSPTGRHLTDAALEGDTDAIDALAEMAGWLGLGIANLVAAFDPEIIVVGGGVSRAGELLLEPTRQSFNETLEGVDHRDPTPIVAAQLGEHAGVIGAGLLAWEACL